MSVSSSRTTPGSFISLSPSSLARALAAGVAAAEPGGSSTTAVATDPFALSWGRFKIRVKYGHKERKPA